MDQVILSIVLATLSILISAASIALYFATERRIDKVIEQNSRRKYEESHGNC